MDQVLVPKEKSARPVEARERARMGVLSLIFIASRVEI
jgi:hypothetical protein